MFLRSNKHIIGYKFRPTTILFYSQDNLSACGRFCSRCRRSDVGLSDGFRSSLFVQCPVGCCLSLSFRTVRPSHLSWLRSAPLQMHKLLEPRRNWAEVFTFPERRFRFFNHSDNPWEYEWTVYVAGKLTSFTTQFIELYKQKLKQIPFCLTKEACRFP